jgi:hypothetical protein
MNRLGGGAEGTNMDEFSFSEWLSQLFSESSDPVHQAVRDGGIILLSLFVGLVLKTILAGSHLGRCIDLLFSSPRKEEPRQLELIQSPGFRPVRVFGWLVVLSCVGAGVWFVTGWRGMPTGREFVWPSLKIGWKIAAFALVAALAARVLAKRMIALIENPPVSETLDRILPVEQKGKKAFSEIVGDGFIILIYAGVSIVGAAAAFDILGLSIGRSFLRLVAVCVNLAGLTVLLFVAVAFRDPIAEIGASAYLKLRKIDRVTINGKPTRIRKRGLFFCECKQGGETIRMSNRALMSAALGGGQGKVGTTPTENASTKVEKDSPI